MHVHIHIHTQIHTDIHIHKHMHTYICVYIYIYIYIYMFLARASCSNGTLQTQRKPYINIIHAYSQRSLLLNPTNNVGWVAIWGQRAPIVRSGMGARHPRWRTRPQAAARWLPGRLGRPLHHLHVDLVPLLLPPPAQAAVARAGTVPNH